MKILQLFFLVIVVLAMVACGKKPDTAKVIELQKEAVAKWVTSINAGNVDALASLFDENTVRMNQNEPILIGKEAVIRHLRSRVEEHSSNEEVKLQDAIVSGDHAVFWGYYKGDYKYHSDGHILHDEGKWVEIKKIQPDGSLKTVISIWNSDLLPVVPNQ